MKKLYATMVMAFAAMTASAQQTTDSTFVRMSFNDNPWNLPTSEMKGWSQYNDEKGCLSDTHTFSLDVNGEELKVILTPSNYKLTDWENCMVRGEDPDDGDKVKTIARGLSSPSRHQPACGLQRSPSRPTAGGQVAAFTAVVLPTTSMSGERTA